jgi:calcium-dependent protein kinase
MRNLLSAIEHCHERGIAHRDIKPDNIMVAESGEIKIIDFGVSKQFKGFYSNKINEININTKDMWTRTGNYVYCAPEIFEGGGYNEKVDIWAAGVLMYQMLTGALPFLAETMMDTIEMITSC